MIEDEREGMIGERGERGRGKAEKRREGEAGRRNRSSHHPYTAWQDRPFMPIKPMVV